jgi:hypothetical protein
MSNEHSDSSLNRFRKWVLIHYKGRPKELQKLASTPLSLITKRDESNKAILGYHIYYGSLYISGIVSYFIGIQKSKQIINAPLITKLKIFFISFSPFLLAYNYVHIKSDYYSEIRPVVITTRKRQNKFYKTSTNQLISDEYRNEYKILCNSSTDEYEYIKQNIGIYKSIKGAIKYYLKLKS